MEASKKISVVIICKNGAAHIERCLLAAMRISNDVIVYDSGSTDGTQNLVQQAGARLVEGPWLGFGPTKRKVTELAINDWVLNLDADEIADDTLINNIKEVGFEDEQTVYRLKFINFLGKQPLRYGEWGNDKHIRVYNRKQVQWNEAKVHESLVLSSNIKIKDMAGHILHYTVDDVADYSAKTMRYGILNAEKYHQAGKQSSYFKILLAPVFAFLKYYFFQLGFLDGIPGLICARMTASYTFIKYARLYDLNRQQSKKE